MDAKEYEVDESELVTVKVAKVGMLMPGAQAPVSSCKSCGCAHLYLIEIKPPRWGKVTMVFQCRHCGRRRNETIVMKACPDCDGENTKVERRADGFRWMRCCDCDVRFKIVD